MTADSLADVESARISLRVGRTDALYPKIPYRRETVIMFSGCTVIVCGQEASSIRLSAFGIIKLDRLDLRTDIAAEW